ncbi:uroporphyrinogen decarboxylase [Macrosteles quadrilineatus]|uniref:uroporphyrinogen decarboxylase n=1 Tax=Macrosteles quadrilineatus TaxID=74068 RepID=UPI0023E0FC77|nr:uroporphyrinogen decarboxylase [Macrosteles quadrilineatus]
MNFPPLKNDRLLRAARGEEVDRVPVWVMRQAGRYLPEFREVRKKHDFFTICQTPELAAEITLQPIRRFDLDAAIIFSDILVVPQALGMIVEMKEGVGPVLPNPLVTPKDIETLQYPVDVRAKLGYVSEAITLTRHKLEGKVPLIGFSGAPFTLMGYMIEGGGSKTLSKVKAWLYRYPEDSRRLLQIISDVVIDYLVEQAAAGAQLLQVFESSAEYLGPEMFRRFALPFLIDVCERVKFNIQERKIGDIRMTVFAKGAHYAIKELANSPYDVVGLDWTVDPEIARKQVGLNITLQGNLDPCALYAPTEEISKMAQAMVEKFGKQRYIANLGHGIYPDVNPDHLKAFIDAIHQI